MTFQVWRFETKQGVDYRIGHQDWVRVGSKFIGVIQSPTNN